MLLIGLPENPITTIEKEMNWGIKACFKETKYDRLWALMIEHNILPIQYFLNNKLIAKVWKWENNVIQIQNNPEPRTFTSISSAVLIFWETVFSRKLNRCGTPCQKYTQKTVFLLLLKSKFTISRKWKAKSTFLNFERNVGATTNLNSVCHPWTFRNVYCFWKRYDFPSIVLLSRSNINFYFVLLYELLKGKIQCILKYSVTSIQYIVINEQEICDFQSVASVSVKRPIRRTGEPRNHICHVADPKQQIKKKAVFLWENSISKLQLLLRQFVLN